MPSSITIAPLAAVASAAFGVAVAAATGAWFFRNPDAPARNVCRTSSSVSALLKTCTSSTNPAKGQRASRSIPMFSTWNPRAGVHMSRSTSCPFK